MRKLIAAIVYLILASSALGASLPSPEVQSIKIHDMPLFLSCNNGYIRGDVASPSHCDTTIDGARISGTLPAATLPLPTASTVGGVKSSAGTTDFYVTGLDLTGGLTSQRPTCANLSDSGAFCNASAIVAPVTITGTTSTITVTSPISYRIFNASGAHTTTLPLASSYTGYTIHVTSIAAQTVDSASSNVVPLAGGAAGTAILAATAGKWARLLSDGTNWIIVSAN